MTQATVQPFAFPTFQSLKQRTRHAPNFTSFGTKTEADTQGLPRYTEAELAQAILKARAEGVEEGKKTAEEAIDKEKQRQEAQVSATLQAILVKCDTVFAAQEQAMEKARTDLTTLAVALAQKVAGEALSASPVPGIEQYLNECLPMLLNEPELHITVHESVLPQISNSVMQSLAQKGYKGNVHLRGRAEGSPAECAITWNLGGVQLDHGAQWQKIKSLLGLPGTI